MKIANSLNMVSSHQVPLGIPFPNGTFYNKKIPLTKKKQLAKKLPSIAIPTCYARELFMVKVDNLNTTLIW